jgi:hypothetical protein
MRVIITNIIGISFILLFVNVRAANMWSKSAKNAYIDRCADSMTLQGLPLTNAKSFCSCAANGMEAEFGTKEYNQLMKANPNPNGGKYDRRLYNVLMSCSKFYPK